MPKQPKKSQKLSKNEKNATKDTKECQKKAAVAEELNKDSAKGGQNQGKQKLLIDAKICSNNEKKCRKVPKDTTRSEV